MNLGLNTMRWALNFGFWGPGYAPTVEMVKHAETLGFDSVWVSEASGTDVVTPLAYMAGQTSRIKLGANAMQMPGRTPATTAMTAVTMDMLTNGRFILGLGASGPGVVEGWHNQPYDKPVSRSREYIAIVRQIIARQRPLEFHGEYFDIPYQKEGATGLANPIKLMVRPRRRRIPTHLAAMSPNNVRLAFETCDGILPVAWSPDREDVFFGPLASPEARTELDELRQERGLGPIEISPFVPAVLGDDMEKIYDYLRPTIAFWLASMGTKSLNFYARLACRFGYENAVVKIQELHAQGRRSEAARLVPQALIDEISLCGPRERIRDRLEVWKASSATTMILCGASKEAMEAVAELVL